MKIRALLLLLAISFAGFAQNNKVIDWINKNAIVIPEADFQIDLALPKEQLSAHFTNAALFGFGEATHNNKEFFDMKSKFFKYLVSQQNVRIFVLEESYGASFFINEYLQGKETNLKTLLSNLQQGIWKTQEIYELIRWMKSYNDNKPATEKIQFYGNDCLFNYGITAIMEKHLEQNHISLDTEEQKLMAFYAKDSHLKEEKATLEQNYIALQKLEEKLNTSSNDLNLQQTFEALKHYGQFLMKPTQETRDRLMAETVTKIHDHLKAKIFIWAHNGHVAKTAIYKEKVPSMGMLLHQKFKERYYAVGFEFGVGTLLGYDHDKKAFENVILEKPIKNTTSEFLFAVDHDNFFLDFAAANPDPLMQKFLSTKGDYIQIGWDGFLPKYAKYRYVTEKYNDRFDGLIYIRKISRSTGLE